MKNHRRRSDKIFLLLHSEQDKPFVGRLHRHLWDLGVTVLADGYEISRRHILEDYIDHAIKRDEIIGVVLSPNCINSRWCQRDLKQIIGAEKRSLRTRIIPLLIGSVALPSFLMGYKYFNFSRSYYKTLTQIVAFYNQIEIPNMTWQHGNFRPKKLDHIKQFFEQAGWEILPAFTWLDYLKGLEELDRKGVHINRGFAKEGDFPKKMVPKEYVKLFSSFT